MLLAENGHFNAGDMMLRLRQGFTLIEIAIVLVVVGILLAGAVTGIKPLIANSRVSQTGKKLDRIELALLTYVMQNGCLPCPANGALGSNDTSGNAGWSRAGGGAYYGPNGPTNQPCAGATGCTGVIGAVPWNTLGIRDSDTVDAWQDRVSYAVTASLTLTAGSSMVRTLPASYPAGDLNVANIAGTSQTDAAAYVLISHGADRSSALAAVNGVLIADPNGAGGAQANNHATTGTGAALATAFIQDTFRPIEGAAHFDDIVRYRTASALIRDCGKNACGNPP